MIQCLRCNDEGLHCSLQGFCIFLPISSCLSRCCWSNSNLFPSASIYSWGSTTLLSWLRECCWVDHFLLSLRWLLLHSLSTTHPSIPFSEVPFPDDWSCFWGFPPQISSTLMLFPVSLLPLPTCWICFPFHTHSVLAILPDLLRFPVLKSLLSNPEFHSSSSQWVLWVVRCRIWELFRCWFVGKVGITFSLLHQVDWIWLSWFGWV